ncbi:MAG: hypothetical protein JO168_07345 [Solirubrobacterales bacterium]|nr:hypothetical protein [Solirubrobacterales bacterium]MBV9714136.1 hypothetical protein [Solirubrobacterales bacterium]
MDLETSVRSYGEAWETEEEDLIVSMFTKDASYRSSPCRDVYRGHAEIRA